MADSKYSNIKIEVADSEESEKVQRFLFSKGFSWMNDQSGNPRFTYAQFIYTSDKYITYSVVSKRDGKSFFNNESKEQRFVVYKDNNPDNEVVDLVTKEELEKMNSKKIVSPNDKVTVELTLEEVMMLRMAISNVAGANDLDCKLFNSHKDFVGDFYEIDGFEQQCDNVENYRAFAFDLLKVVFADYYAQQEQQERQFKIDALKKQREELDKEIASLESGA